jgi:multidrug efflux pump subunit AcrA (membrane-fusion protein)
MALHRRGWLVGFASLATGIALLWWSAERGALRRITGDATEPAPGVSAPPRGGLDRVAALGRLEPHRGVIRVAGPPRPAVVIEELHVEEGDRVEQGKVIAVLAGIGVQRAEVARLRAELANAERELERNRKLRGNRVLSESDWQAVQLARDVARAGLDRAEAELELSTVRSPIEGQVLEIHTRAGERVGLDGIAELGATSAMYAVAEVYETDIGRVQVGQRARIRSPALPRELEGQVERIGLKIGKKDVLSTDPVADADARVVEVEIRLAEPDLAAALTNLRVDVVIEP